MKRGFLQTLSIFSILMINSVSASFHYGYGRFSLRGFIDTFDPAVLTLVFLFFIFLIVLNNLVFIDFFRGQRAPAIVVSALISFLSVYWMYQKGWYLDQPLIFPILIASVTFGVIALILTKGFKINKALSAVIALAIAGIVGFIVYDSGLGISDDILFPIVSFLLTLGIIVLIWKKKFTWFLIISGFILILTTFFTDIFYEEGLVAFIGFVLLGIGLLLAWRNRGRNAEGGTRSLLSRPGRIRRGAGWLGRKSLKSATAAGRGIGRGSQKAWSGTFARGRNMSIRRAEKAAYKEEARRQKERGRPEREAYKEDAGRQRDQQKEREKAERAAYKEEARRQKEMKMDEKDKLWAEKEAYKEEARRQKQIERDEIRAHKENVKRLKEEYKILSQQNAVMFDRNRGIPPRGTVDGRQRSQNIERMKNIEKMIKIKPQKAKSRKRGWFR